MKLALAVNKITNDINKNVENIIKYINIAADREVDLIIFSETAITGLKNNDIPGDDINLGININSNIIDRFCHIAKIRNINIALGLFEEENGCLYDSSIFINRKGEIPLKYRRISKGWHDPSIVNSIYKEGNEIEVYKSDIGTVGFLICGDLFDNSLCEKIKEKGLDYLIFPFARSFYDGSYNKEKWNEEFKDYIQQIKICNTTTLGVNYIDSQYFGGAFVIKGNGEVIENFAIGKEGIYFTNLY